MGKVELRNKAILLRKRGKTYNEILRDIPVAKSTISLWLRKVGLSKKQNHRLTIRKRNAQVRGADARKLQREQKLKRILEESQNEIKTLNEREIFLIGTALYWAEGTKQRETSVSQCVSFSNSDPRMVSFFFAWLKLVFGATEEDLRLSIYLHKNHMYRVKDVKNYWASALQIPSRNFAKVYVKMHNPSTNRQRVMNFHYFGILRIELRSSTDFNRKISGWIQGISNCQIV